MSIGEIREGSEINAETPIEEVQRYLVIEAQNALSQPNFENRNNLMGRAVGEESGLLAAKSVNNPEATDKLISIFTQASEESGQKFSGAFDENGVKIGGKDKEYKEAMNAAGGVALEHLPEALGAAGIEVDIRKLLKEATFDDVLRVTAEQLGQEAPEGLKPKDVKKSLHETAKGDYFEDQIDSLPFGKEGQEPLGDEDKKALDVAVRLANATWKAGQVHRAAWEGNDSRIDPNKRDAFNPFDLLKKAQYEGEIKKGRTPEEALTRVALEVYKDVLQYKPLVEKK